ncbi:YidH family protein [Halomonadaceae bacterium KBTZ08]
MNQSSLKVLEDPELSDWQRAMLFQNVQRSRLSNERNFLNWVRTSLALITLGFIVQRFGVMVNPGDGGGTSAMSSVVTLWVPLLFFALGAFMVALGTWEFFRVRKEINQGRWHGLPWLRDTLIVVTLVFMLIVLVIFVLGNL